VELVYHIANSSPKSSMARNTAARPVARAQCRIENLVVRLTRENSGWGYDQIVGALANLGHAVSDQTVGNILRRHGITPIPERSQTTTWRDFIRVSSAGITDRPDASWISQVARNATLEELGYLNDRRYVLHDRDAKFCAEIPVTPAAWSVKCLRLPPRNPNSNAFAERLGCGRSKRSALSKLILFGEASLRRALTQFQEHYHSEHNHQGRATLCYTLFPGNCQRAGGHRSIAATLS
jgi:hypothetical protein